MSALDHIKAYLKAHFANHDIETLMTHLETAIEAKIEAAVAEVRQEMDDLKQHIADLQNKVDHPILVVDPPAQGTAGAPPVMTVKDMSLEPGAIARSVSLTFDESDPAASQTEGSAA